MSAVQRTLVELHCDSPTRCPEVWVGGTGQTEEEVRRDAVAAGWSWMVPDNWQPTALHWCPGPHERRVQ